MRQEAKLRETLSIGQDILKRCHPDALTTLKHWLSVLRSRWEEVGKFLNLYEYDIYFNFNIYRRYLLW